MTGVQTCALPIFLEQEEDKQENESIIEMELAKINPLEMTPIEALNTLYDLKSKLKKK